MTTYNVPTGGKVKVVSPERLRELMRMSENFNSGAKISVGMEEAQDIYRVLHELISFRGKWIKCSDKMPLKNVDVLCCFFDGIMAVLSCDHDLKRPWRDSTGTGEGQYENDSVTHWMPLPAPPEPQ